jgi:tape measure domain-containing protein
MSTITSEIRLRVRAEGDKVLADLGTKLNNLANQATLSSNNFKGLAEELKKVQQTTVQSTNNIKAYSGAWKELAANVDISSKEFKQATAEADALDARLKAFQGVQTTVATNFRNIASSAKQASAAMQTATGLIRDPLTGAYRGTAGKTQYDAPIGPVAPPDTAGRYAQQQREADAQSRRDARRRETMQQRASYFGDISGGRDPRTGAIIAGGMGPFQSVGTQYARPIGPELPPPPRRRFTGAAQTAGTIAASGIFGGPEGLVGSGIGAAVGGPMGAAAGGAIGAQVGVLRQAIGETATYASEITKLNIALQGITKTSQEYSNAQNAINSISKSLNVPIAEATSGFTRLSASVIGAGGNVNDAEIVFRGITTAMKATGRSTADVQGAILAMSQVFSKGKVTAEELSGQLGERLPGAVTAFAEATGRTLPELQKDLEDGVVGLNDVMKFAIALQVKYGETAAKVANSSEESGARMTVAFDELKFAIGQTFQPIGADFQNSITEMVNASVAALKIFKEKIDESNKSIANLIGNDNLKGIQSFFKTIVLETLASIDPLTRAYLLLQKIRGSIPKGDPNLTPQELGKTGYAGRYPIPVSEQTDKFVDPKKDQGEKKDRQDEINYLKNIAKYRDMLNARQVDILQTVNALERESNAFQLQKNQTNEKEINQLILANNQAVLILENQKLVNEATFQYIDAMAQAQKIKDKTERQLQRAAAIQKGESDKKRLELALEAQLDNLQNKSQQNNKKTSEEIAKQLTDSERLYLVLQDQLAIARATTPEQKLRLESIAREKELNRDAAALVDTRANAVVKEKDAQNLILQIELERLNLQTQLAALQPKSPLQEFVKQASTELQNLEGVAVTVSQGIGDAIGNSLSSGIQGLVEGTANAQQIFSDFLKSIGQILIQEGAKMIATYTAIAIAKSLAGLFGGGGGGGGAQGFQMPEIAPGVGSLGSQRMFAFAEGGIPPIGRPSLVGEKGPELFVPRTSGTIVPADATAAAMARYQRQGGSSSGNSSSDAMGADAVATPVLSMSFETTRFLGQDYVSTDQLQAAMIATEKRAASAGAKAGAAQVSSQMRNSPAYRRQVGLR